MQIAVGFLDRLGDLAVDGGHAAQREEMTLRQPGNFLHFFPVTADHAFTMGIDDQQVRLLLAGQGLFNPFSRRIDDTQNPVDLVALLQPPDLACRVALPGQFFGKQLGFPEPL